MPQQYSLTHDQIMFLRNTYESGYYGKLDATLQMHNPVQAVQENLVGVMVNYGLVRQHSTHSYGLSPEGIDYVERQALASHELIEQNRSTRDKILFLV